MSKKKYCGKTLLVLGSNVGAADIVTYAKENGACVIVSDYYPPEKSEAKRIADKKLSISTADFDQLSKVIERYHVNGVLAGISEFNLVQAMTLSEKHDLPFYCSKRQWDMVERKDEFRELCEKHNVPHPETYYTGRKLTDEAWSKITFPAVIKPVDASSSAGVHICGNVQELKKYEDDSIDKSVSGRIIIEEFVKGEEFTAHYTVVNGKAKLACVDNRYPAAVHEGAVTTVPVARIYPCTYLNEYLKQVNAGMIDLCESIGMKNGILFVQGLYEAAKNNFHIFEAGLRSAGEAPYRFIKEINGICALHLLVDQVLSTVPDYDLEMEDPYLKGKCCGIVSFIAKGGTVGSIEGLEEAVRRTPSVKKYESRYPVGSVTPDGDTLRQLMIRFIMICESREQMAGDVDYLNKHITVLNNKGEDMVIKMNTEFLRGGGYRAGKIICFFNEVKRLNSRSSGYFLRPESGVA